MADQYNNVAYPYQQPQPGPAGNFVPEWRRIMTSDEELFSVNLPCVAAFFCPNIVAALAAFRVGGAVDAVMVYCCFPCVCGCYRSTIKRALGVDMTNDSCLMNCCLHYWCYPCAASQEYRAVEIWVQSGANAISNAVPGAPMMY